MWGVRRVGSGPLIGLILVFQIKDHRYGPAGYVPELYRQIHYIHGITLSTVIYHCELFKVLGFTKKIIVFKWVKLFILSGYV